VRKLETFSFETLMITSRFFSR